MQCYLVHWEWGAHLSYTVQLLPLYGLAVTDRDVAWQHAFGRGIYYSSVNDFFALCGQVWSNVVMLRPHGLA